MKNYLNNEQGEKNVFTLNDYQKLASRTHNMDLGYRDTFANYSMSLAEEAGEVAGVAKKNLYHGHELDRDDLIKEYGDVLWYLAMGAHINGITLEEIATANIDKLNKRYRDGFSKEASKNREEYK